MWRTCQLPVALIVLGPLTVGAAEKSPSPGQSTPAAKATVRDFGAVGDGVADDTAALQRAVDARLGDVRLPRGVYRISKPILIELDVLGPTSLLGSGTARIVMAGAGPALRFVGTHDGTADPKSVKPNVWRQQRMPTVDGLEIVGAHQQAVGLEATGTMQLTITRLAVRHALHGIHLTKRNRNLIISNCHLYKNRGIGIYFDNVNLHQTNITGCHISYNSRGGVVVRGGSVFNIHISGCDIEANMDPAPETPPSANILIEDSGAPRSLGEVAITGCTIQHTTRSPGSANIRVIGVECKRPPWGNLVISGNVINDVEVNVDLKNICSATIVGNNFQTGVRHNLRIENCCDIVVGANAFDRSPVYGDQKYAGNALLLRNCQDCTLNALHIKDVRRAPAGIVLQNCRRLNVTGCTILDCDNSGLLLTNVSTSRVSGCLIHNDRSDAGSWMPLVVAGGSGNMIVNNLLGGPLDLDPRSAHSSGNVILP